MKTKKSKEKRELDIIIQRGLALLICDLSEKLKTIDDLMEIERRTHQIERLSDVYRRVGE